MQLHFPATRTPRWLKKLLKVLDAVWSDKNLDGPVTSHQVQREVLAAWAELIALSGEGLSNASVKMTIWPFSTERALQLSLCLCPALLGIGQRPEADDCRNYLAEKETIKSTLQVHAPLSCSNVLIPSYYSIFISALLLCCTVCACCISLYGT